MVVASRVERTTVLDVRNVLSKGHLGKLVEAEARLVAESENVFVIWLGLRLGVAVLAGVPSFLFVVHRLEFRGGLIFGRRTQLGNQFLLALLAELGPSFGEVLLILKVF